MRKLKTIIESIEAGTDATGILMLHKDWNDIRSYLEKYVPEFVGIGIGHVYLMKTKKGTVRVVVTKENTKTWVMYETGDSYEPGMRWMVGKTWCRKENIERDEAQSYVLPPHVKVK